MTQKEKNSALPKIISVSGPSGVGKSSFIHRILKERSILRTTVTYTTRKKREMEFEGISYFYVNQKKFLSLTKENFFVEWAKVHSFYYGTEEKQIKDAWKKGKCVILDVDIQGALSLKKKYSQIFSIFIKPPKLKDLYQRIKKRGEHEDSKDLKLRMNNAKKELEKVKFFDIVILNDQFEKAYQDFKEAVDYYIKK